MVNYTIHETLANATLSLLKRYLSVLVLVICSTLSTPLFAADEDELYASVDRTQIYQNETIELTIIGQLELELNFSNLFNLRNMELPAPDIGSLEKDFAIVDQQQKYNIQSINGDNKATITWVYSLAPKRTGELTVPAIKHNEKTSKPVIIKVLEGKPSVDDGRPPMIFMEAEVDKQEVYVQEQIVYTLRLYYADNLAGGELSSPELNNAIIEQVGDQKKYNRMRYNQRYEVIERKFLIFPQKSGEITIAPQTFNGTIIDTRMRKRRHVRDNTEAVTVNVLPPASEFTGQIWLPAISLNLNEKWDKPLENISVGDSFTRTISIHALGLLGSALPPFNLPENGGFKQYPDQPKTESLEHPAGVESSRTISIAMVAVNAGTITLPEIKIPWWDTINQVERIAIIPSRELTVAASSQGAQTGMDQHDTTYADSSPETIAKEPEASSDGESVSSDTGSDNSVLYIVIILLLIAGWGATTVILLKRKTADNNPQEKGSTTAPESNEETAFNALSESIRQKSPSMMGDLVQWAKLKWPTATINSVADIDRLLDDEAFSVLISRAETDHYASPASKQKGTAEWDNNALIKRLAKIRKKSEGQTKKELPGFYP
ncbi:BatD family protein [Alkalimarinus alittae]|uniref:BatD family protein n=1 Tax=Alkalimarinus alittae TaxID=2961619 RepID=A0ABY6N661_9ALTE|nr:BatD family protein [Alkalimarinus alittae]UZE97576.1 BatD family protein [Alkalimarinus alittae]